MKIRKKWPRNHIKIIAYNYSMCLRTKLYMQVAFYCNRNVFIIYMKSSFAKTDKKTFLKWINKQVWLIFSWMHNKKNIEILIDIHWTGQKENYNKSK